MNSQRRLKSLFWGLPLALMMLSACATMETMTKRTADSPAHPWTPPAQEMKTPEPLINPLVPAELLAPGRPWTLADIVDVRLANNP